MRKSRRGRLSKQPQDGIEGDPSQRDDDLWLDVFDLALQIRLAICHLLRCGFVARRRTATDSRDVNVVQGQPVSAVMRFGLACESGAEERRVEELAGGVAGEHAPGAVGAVRAGGESHSHHARLRVAKARDGFAPVFPVAIGATLEASNLFPPGNQARTAAALEQCRVEGVEEHG